MRVATWNCQKDIVNHWDVLEKLNVDVIAVQECKEGTPDKARQEGWGCEWRPGGWDKGIAVLSRPPYAIESADCPEPYFIAALVDGPTRFRFVCFWAMTPKFAGAEYPAQATRMIELLPRDDVPTVIGGDFNASRSEQHLANVNALKELELVSAYHKHHGVEQLDVAGFLELYDPTSYHLWREDKPFHMDFVFVPNAWTIKDVEVGSLDDYVRAGLSDHVPIVVTASP